jgi:hypothetical protein
MMRLRGALALGLLVSAAAHAEYELIDTALQKRTDAVLAVMGYTVVPDLTTSTLSISSTDTGNPQMTMSQLAGGFTISQNTPLYLEGGAAYSRYDPSFVVSDGTDTREVPLKWTSVMLTGGVGWDFPVIDKLKFRPIANFAYGHLESDLSAFSRLLEFKSQAEKDFIDGGSMDALGYGGSVMLDYEDYLPEREIDVEWRYSYVRLENYDSTSDFVDGSSNAISTNIWARWRAPTGWALMERPLRYVLEFAHSTFWGDQKEAIGFDDLTSLGVGIEFDSSKYDIIISRTRLVFRYRFGEDVEGTAVGFAVSF